MQVVTVQAEYRARTHDADDEALLREVFGPTVPVRLRPLRLPEAGGSFEIWLLVTYFGTRAADALIGEATSATRKKIVSGIRTFFEHKVRKEQPPDMAVTFSYEDVEIRIPSLASNELPLLNNITDIVRDHLQSAALRHQPPTVIVAGLARDDGDSIEWYEPNAGNALEPDRRYWGLSLENHRALTHVYDTETRLLSESRVR